MAVEAEFGGLKVPLQTILRYTFKMLYEADVVHVPRTKHDTCQIFEKVKGALHIWCRVHAVFVAFLTVLWNALLEFF